MNTETPRRHQPSPAQVAQAFLTPRRADAAVDTPDWPGAERLSLPGPANPHDPDGGTQLGLQRAGQGPRVLLLHGWEGSAADLAPFAAPLVARGYQVLALDLPAHARSGGRRTSIPHSARALRAAVAALGPLHGAITHSVGGAVLAEALAAGLPVERVALIAPPARYDAYARQVAAQAGLDAAGTEQLLALLAGHIGQPLHEIDLPARAAAFGQPALLVHSADDRVVAIADSLASAAAWPGARHWRVDGLGHRRILQDAAVRDGVLDFVAPPRRGQP